MSVTQGGNDVSYKQLSTHSEYPQSPTMQLWERLSADVADHVHGLFRQKLEPGLCQGQEVFCLLLWLQ